jgi:hypothetical protein
MRIARLDREDFLAHRFDYQPGEIVGFWDPLQQGKTHLMYQMLDVAMDRHPYLRTVAMMPKAIDPATSRWAAQLDLKVLDSWPPARRPWEHPRGYVLWPKHLDSRVADVEANRAHLARVFRQAISDQFRQGSSITVADDVYLLAVLLGLNMDLEELWTAGGGPKAGLWSTNQKPSGTQGGGAVSTFSYSAPTHFIIGKDTDHRNQRRFAEIGGGVDPQLVTETVANLRIYRVQTADGWKNISEKLYIHKGGPYMAIIGL